MNSVADTYDESAPAQREDSLRAEFCKKSGYGSPGVDVGRDLARMPEDEWRAKYGDNPLGAKDGGRSDQIDYQLARHSLEGEINREREEAKRKVQEDDRYMSSRIDQIDRPLSDVRRARDNLERAEKGHPNSGYVRQETYGHVHYRRKSLGEPGNGVRFAEEDIAEIDRKIEENNNYRWDTTDPVQEQYYKDQIDELRQERAYYEENKDEINRGRIDRYNDYVRYADERVNRAQEGLDRAKEKAPGEIDDAADQLIEEKMRVLEEYDPDQCKAPDLRTPQNSSPSYMHGPSGMA